MKGKCPECDSVDLEWKDSVIQDRSRGFNFKCEECDTKATEWYALEYIETEVRE